MTINVSDGYLPVEEGSIYWQYVEVDNKTDKSRPTLIFMHAGVTDHTLWDNQVEFVAEKGWSSLTFDLFGFGKSVANEQYLRSVPRQPFDMLAQVDQLREAVLPADSKVIPVGLSIGGSLALGYTVNRKESVAGAVLVSAGLLGFEADNTPAEDRLFRLAEDLLRDGDVQGAANLQVRIWGDGPLQEPGRMAEPLAEQMLKWNIEICAREAAKTGGCALDSTEPEKPAGSMLHEIDVPIAVAYGSYDETYTIVAMKHVGSKVKGATIKEFAAAHMINMEFPEEFNKWLGVWLETNFED